MRGDKVVFTGFAPDNDFKFIRKTQAQKPVLHIQPASQGDHVFGGRSFYILASLHAGEDTGQPAYFLPGGGYVFGDEFFAPFGLVVSFQITLEVLVGGKIRLKRNLDFAKLRIEIVNGHEGGLAPGDISQIGLESFGANHPILGFVGQAGLSLLLGKLGMGFL